MRLSESRHLGSNPSPAALAKRSDHMRLVRARRLKVKQERHSPLIPKNSGGERRSLKTVRRTMQQRFTRRAACLSVRLEIHCQRTEKILHFCRSVQFLEHLEFRHIWKWKQYHRLQYSPTAEA